MTEADNNPKLERLTYTVTETAQLLGISRTTAYECIKTGEIPSITLRRRIVVPRQVLRELLAGSRRKTSETSLVGR